MAGYAAAKAGLEGLLRAALAEYGRLGLRVTVVRPGYIETPMLNVFEPRFLDLVRAGSGGFLQPGEVAAALLRALDEPPPAGSLHLPALAPESAHA
jgi:3-oxoacyl-[acyl-carrier protein] reductase